MRAKFFLVLALGITMAFSEGCSIQQLLAGMQQPGGSPLGQPGLPGVAQQPGPLGGSLAGGLPPFSPDPTAQAGLAPQVPANVPTSPATTPVDPNATTPPAATGGTPLASPLGSGPIDPATLPTLPAAPVNVNPLAALSPTLPQPAGL